MWKYLQLLQQFYLPSFFFWDEIMRKIAKVRKNKKIITVISKVLVWTSGGRNSEFAVISYISINIKWTFEKVICGYNNETKIITWFNISIMKSLSSSDWFVTDWWLLRECATEEVVLRTKGPNSSVFHPDPCAVKVSRPSWKKN